MVLERKEKTFLSGVSYFVFTITTNNLRRFGTVSA